ncbi:hypothetical protein KAR48_01450 [bacterium]|nr:hypothetical protein [bacterium]
MKNRNLLFVIITISLILNCKKSSSPFDLSNHVGNTWDIVYEFPVERNFSAIDFINENVGWAVGDSGMIICTIDQGKTWNKQVSGVSYKLNDIQFVNENEGWIAGSNNTMLKTVNGGQDWIAIEIFSDTLKTFMSLHFIDAKIGWVADSRGGIWHTSDSGDSWTRQESHTHWAITGIQFLNKDEGWAITTNKIALHTTNGGLSWESILIPTIDDHEAIVCDDIFFIDKNHGWIVGWYAGAWPRDNPVYYMKDASLFWGTKAIVPCSMIHSIIFIDRNIGWIAGNGKILFTFDGGSSWHIQYEDDTEHFRDLCFTDERNGWAVGFTGKIFQYMFDN